MKSFSKIVTLVALFLAVSFVAAHGQNVSGDPLNQAEEMAKQGDPQVQAGLGAKLFQQAIQIEARDPEWANKQFAKAVHWFKLAAKQNQPSAQHMLGVCYQYGKGVSQDIEKAVTWYTKGAENGDPLAQLRLGQCYHSGIGVQKNSKEALKWFSRSASRNIPEAQYWVGVYLEKGLCQSVKYSFEGGNLHEANDWYHRAADNGFYPAANEAYRTDIMIQNALEAGIDAEVRRVISEGRIYKPQGIITSDADPVAAFPDLFPQYYPEFYPNSYPDTYSNPYSNPYFDSYSNPYMNSYPNTYSDPYFNSYPYNY